MLSGDYKQAIELAARMNMANSEALKKVEYEMYEQEYMEMIEGGRRLEAVQ